MLNQVKYVSKVQVVPVKSTRSFGFRSGVMAADAMSQVPDYVQNAANEAYDVAARCISGALHSDVARPGEVALALAHAYGQAVGAYVVNGATATQLDALNRAVARANHEMVSRLRRTDL